MTTPSDQPSNALWSVRSTSSALSGPDHSRAARSSGDSRERSKSWSVAARRSSSASSAEAGRCSSRGTGNGGPTRMVAPSTTTERSASWRRTIASSAARSGSAEVRPRSPIRKAMAVAPGFWLTSRSRHMPSWVPVSG